MHNATQEIAHLSQQREPLNTRMIRDCQKVIGEVRMRLHAFELDFSECQPSIVQREDLKALKKHFKGTRAAFEKLKQGAYREALSLSTEPAPRQTTEEKIQSGTLCDCIFRKSNF